MQNIKGTIKLIVTSTLKIKKKLLKAFKAFTGSLILHIKRKLLNNIFLSVG